jgi:hypothetical protein
MYFLRLYQHLVIRKSVILLIFFAISLVTNEAILLFLHPFLCLIFSSGDTYPFHNLERSSLSCLFLLIKSTQMRTICSNWTFLGQMAVPAPISTAGFP